MKTALLTLALLSGCAPCSDGLCVYGPDEMGGQDVAQAITWRDYYGEAGAVPAIHWVALGDCDTAYAGPGSGITNPDTGACDLGIYHEYTDEAWVSVLPRFYSGNEEAKHETWYTYAHELMHAHLKRSTGDPDNSHSRPEWGRDGHVDMPTRAVYLMRVEGDVW